MIEAGKLNRQIVLFRPVSAVSVRALSDLEQVAKLWSEVRAVTAREQMRSGIDIQSGQYTARIRYRAGITIDCIVKLDTLYYSIDSIQVNPLEQEIILALSYNATLNQNERFTS